MTLGAFPTDVDDATAEAVLAGRAGGPDDLTEFADMVRAAGGGPAPAPSPTLATMLAEGFSSTSDVPGVASLASGRPDRRRRTMALAEVVAGLSLIGKIALGTGVAAASVTAAGAANVLPAPAQRAVAAAVGTATPFTLPSGPAERIARTEERLAAAEERVETRLDQAEGRVEKAAEAAETRVERAEDRLAAARARIDDRIAKAQARIDQAKADPATDPAKLAAAQARLDQAKARSAEHLARAGGKVEDLEARVDEHLAAAQARLEEARARAGERLAATEARLEELRNRVAEREAAAATAQAAAHTPAGTAGATVNADPALHPAAGRSGADRAPGTAHPRA